MARVDEQVADRIIALLEQGELPPWEKDWSETPMPVPVNAVSQRPYRGINLWMTVLTQYQRRYQDHRWLTYRQAKELGGYVREGETSTLVVFWKIVDRKDNEPDQEDAETPDKRGKSYPLLRSYRVFNVEQTEDCRLKALPEPEHSHIDPLGRAEAIVAGMPSPPRIETYPNFNDPPRYIPRRDLVRIPHISRYSSAAGYYNTLFHELTHATGHPDRLARFDFDANADNLHNYGREELVAGMGSAMLAAHAGIGVEVEQRDASYIKEWLARIRADKSLVVAAAQRAQKAVDYIIPAPAVATAGADC